MDFKWTLSRPGIELEFETGSIKEAIGLLEQEGTSISEVFGFNLGGQGHAAEQPQTAAEEPKTRKPRTPKEAAVAPAPLPVPTATTLPPNALNGAGDLAPAADGGIPPFLARTPPLPTSSSPPLAPTPPPVGVLGPKVVLALNALKEGKPDDGQALADWLAASGLTIKGANYDAACRVVLMTADEKLKGVAEALKIAA